MAGLYFEDFTEGRIFEHAFSRTVTETDNTMFSLLTLNPQPLHIDADFASRIEWGQRQVNSLFTLGTMIGMTVYDTTPGTTVGNLGMNDVRFPKPVFHGDTLKAHSTVPSIRSSRSRPDAGLVAFEHRCTNQHGGVVVICRRTAMMMRRPEVA